MSTKISIFAPVRPQAPQWHHQIRQVARHCIFIHEGSSTKEDRPMQAFPTGSARDLFTPIEVGPLTLPNRVVMAPLTRSRAGPGNVPTPLSALYYAQRASAGLIVSEATQIAPEGQGYVTTPGIHSAEQVAGWKWVTGAVHACGRLLRSA
jgi:hypothetical protein